MNCIQNSPQQIQLEILFTTSDGPAAEMKRENSVRSLE